MDVQIVLGHIDDAAGDIGAVVGGALQIRQQVCPHKARLDAALALTHPQDVTGPRPIWLNNEQAVIAPEWSIHCAAGTSNYTFIWGMVGENLIYNDMQIVKITTLE